MIQSRAFLPVLLLAAAAVCPAQPNRLPSGIDTQRRVILAGHVPAAATAANDSGTVESGFSLPFLTLVLKPSADQQAALQQLLDDQQNPAAAGFRHWLTPEQYADRFGISPHDLAQIAAWLESQGFTVDPFPRSRTFLTFHGIASQVEAAFGAAIHRYRVNGEPHYANSTDPQVPAALASLVAGIRGLSDFHPRPRAVPQPHWTNPPDGLTTYAVSPDDFASIYDVSPLYAQGINGSGQTIAIVGQSALNNNGADVTAFWKKFGISAQLSTRLVPHAPNPGIVPAGVDEASLDTEWAGAVARGVNVVFVYAPDAFSAAQYVVDQNLAPILSESLGLCEAEEGLVQMPVDRQLVLQANAQGITWLAAAGDSGAMDCDNSDAVAEGGLAVDVPGSIPEVTAMGGTMLAVGTRYWNTTNSSTGESAKGYVPENVWNDTPIAGRILATGGGASSFFPQPVWQSGFAPGDGWRHLPDVSFNSSVYVTPYYIQCSAAQCFEGGANGGIEYLGGTSCAAPAMAGVVALLNQSLKTNGLGNINPTLYSLARNPAAYSSAFHDITSGNNVGPCAYASPGCPGSGVEGYTAAAGYDDASGLGSLDVANLLAQWRSAEPSGAVLAPAIDQNPVTQGNPEICGNASQWNFQLTLSEEAGFAATLGGFKINGTDYSSQINSIFGNPAIPAHGSISGCYTLSGLTVPANESFLFSGVDANNNAWSVSMTIPFQPALAPLSVSGATNAASYQQVFAPGMLMSVFGTGLGTFAQLASTIPLPEFMAGLSAIVNGYPAPLYYVGPNQVNLQIPYEVSGAAELILLTPYQPSGVVYNFRVAATAPGIFVFPDGSSDLNPSRIATAGQTSFLFLTGEGLVSPALADGATPSASTPLGNLPKPRAAVSVTVAGLNAPTTFVGIPPGLVGVTQINFTVPIGVPSGRQPVVVTVGTTQTPTAYINVQ